MAVGGALAGLGGLTQLAGAEFKLRPGFVAGYGYIGFLASWLGRHRPVYVVARRRSLLSTIVVGGDSLQIDSGLPGRQRQRADGAAAADGLRLRRKRQGRRATHELWLSEVLTGGIRGGTSILYAALGESVSERGGVINLGTEGSMLCGALAAYAVAAETGNVWVGVVAGASPAALLAVGARLLRPRRGAPTSWPPASSCCSSGSA